MASTGSTTTEEQEMTSAKLLELKNAFFSLMDNIEEIQAKHALTPPQTEQTSEMMEKVKAEKLQVEKSKEVLHQIVSQLEKFKEELGEEKWRLEEKAEFLEEAISNNARGGFNLVEEIEQKYALIPPQTLEEVQELVGMRAMEHKMEESVRRMAEVNISRPALLLRMEEMDKTGRDLLGVIRKKLDTIRLKEQLLETGTLSLEVKGDHDRLVDGGDPVKMEEKVDGIQE